VVEGGVREQLARALHEDHVARTGVGEGLHRPWDELGDEQRESSRRQADAIIAGLAGVDRELLPLRHWGRPTATLTPVEVEQLAEGEHQRWFDERTAAGWRYGAVRDDGRKENPLLVPWTDLGPDERKVNTDGVEGWPAMLARAGFELVPARQP
jgi:hypothetical protein